MIFLLVFSGIILIAFAIIGLSESFILFLLLLICGIADIAAVIRLRQYKKKLAYYESEYRPPADRPTDAPAAPVRAASNSIDNMTGVQFEQFCCRLLEAYGFANIKQTPASGDHGVDILAWKSGKKYAIQCKRYKQNVGNKAVQEVYTGKQLYAAGEAIVLTSSYFTAQAKQEADDLGVTLWDRDGLKHIMDMTGINDVTL